MKRKFWKVGQSSPENVSHNHDFDPEEAAGLENTPPQRDVTEADFGAEYHGFTGFERAGKGSWFRRKKKSRTAR